MAKSIKALLGKYWLVQIIIISILGLYALLATLSLGLILVDPTLVFPSLNNSQENATFTVVIMFESNVPNKNITWNPVIVNENSSISLFDILNSSVALSGTEYSGLGFFVTGINGLMQSSSYYWQYYYYSFQQHDWILAPVGVSSFIVDSNTYIRFILG